MTPSLHPDTIEETLHRTWERLSYIGKHNAAVYAARGMEVPYGCCKECTNELDNFMLVPEVWALVSDKQSDHLCLTCAERLLGRPFQISDFTQAPINRGIMMGIKLGLAHNTVPHVQA